MYHYDLQMITIGLKPWQQRIIDKYPVSDHFSFHIYHYPQILQNMQTGRFYLVRVESSQPALEVMNWLEENLRAKDQIILIADSKTVSIMKPWQRMPEQTLGIWPVDLNPDLMQYHVQKLFTEIHDYMNNWQRDQFFNGLMKSTPNMIWFKRKDGIHIKVNDSFCRTVNKSIDDVQGRDHNYIWDVDPEEAGGNDCNESDKMVMENGRTFINEESVKAGNKLKILTTIKSPLYDLADEVMGTVGIGIDITQERAYQEQIENKNQVLETIFASVDCGILCHSVDGKRILSCNVTALNLLGYSSVEEMLDDHFDGIAATVPQEDRKRLRRAMESVENKGDAANVEYRAVHKDGTTKHIMGSIKLIEDCGERFYQRFLLDVTEQKLQEKETQRYHNELIHALTIDFSYVRFINLASSDSDPASDTIRSSILGLKRLSLGGFAEEKDSPFRKLYIEDREKFDQIFVHGGLLKELEKKSVYYMNVRMVEEGQILYYQIKVVRSGIWDDHFKGAVIGLRSMEDEIRKEMEQRQLLENALSQAQSANKAKTVFLSNMSHDIRTPMNAILGFSNLALDRHKEPDELHDYLDKIQSSGKLLLKLINDILDMSSIESGRFQFNEERFKMGELVGELRNIIASTAYEKHLQVSFDTDEVNQDWIQADRLRLHQALMNVLGNATKYTNQGGRVCLSISRKNSLIQDKDNYTFTVSDTGIGMSDDFISHIYELFTRERTSTNSGIEGTGLGMAITKNIVDAMSGHIEVKSEQGKGTEVQIVIPIRVCANEVETEVLPVKEPEVLSDCETKRILLVEDNLLNQEIALAILEDEGFQVDVANNGLEAVEIVAQSSPGCYHLILMDIQMPVMNGYEATRQIRAMKNPAAKIPIIAMTANAFEEDKQNAIVCGMNDHIAKPIDPDLLFASIASVLAQTS